MDWTTMQQSNAELKSEIPQMRSFIPKPENKRMRPGTISSESWLHYMHNAKHLGPPDLEFFVGKDPFVWRVPAHKQILARQSPVFQAQIELLKAGEQMLEIQNIRPEIFQDFLKFLYTGQTEFTCIETGLGLYEIAHKYDVKPLLQDCKCYLINMIGEFNVLPAFPIIKEQVDEKDVKLLLHCYRVIDRNIDSILESKTFENLPLQLLKEICSRGNLKLSSELLLFKGLVRWTLSECKRRSLPITHWNVRLLLGDVIYTVRFDQIVMQDLFDEFMNSGFFSEGEAETLVNSIYGSGERISKNYLSARHYQETVIVDRFSAADSMVLPPDSGTRPSPHAAIAFVFDRDVILEAVRLSAKANGVSELQNYANQGNSDINKMSVLIRRHRAHTSFASSRSIEDNEQLVDQICDLELVNNANTKKTRSEVKSGFSYDDRALILLTDENSKVLAQIKRSNEDKAVPSTDVLVSLFLPDPVLLKSGRQYRLYSWLPANRALNFAGQGQSTTTYYDGTTMRSVQWQNCPPLQHQESINGTTVEAGQYFGLQIYY